jgi:hypothetical protein
MPRKKQEPTGTPTAAALTPDSVEPDSIDSGDVVQVIKPDSKRIAQVAIVYRVDSKGLLCYQPRAASKPESFLISPADVARIGKAKLRYKKEL